MRAWPVRRRAATRCACALAAVALIACASTPAPQAREASARDVALVNAGFESAQTANGHPPGWVPIHHASAESYAVALDANVRRSGTNSLRIFNIGPEPFGTIVQKLNDPALRGRTVRFSAWLRTQDVKGNSLGGGAVLLVQAMRNGVPVAHDHMRAAPVRGTTDWRAYAITLAVPDHADEVEIGAMLFGGGTVWVDDAKLEIVSP